MEPIRGASSPLREVVVIIVEATPRSETGDRVVDRSGDFFNPSRPAMPMPQNLRPIAFPQPSPPQQMGGGNNHGGSSGGTSRPPPSQPQPSQPSQPSQQTQPPVSKDSKDLENTGRKGEEIKPVNAEPSPSEKEGIEGEKKGMEEIAKDIAKQLIPDKFNFLIQMIPLKFAAPLQKGEEEKPPEEENTEKSPASKSNAIAKGEAKTLQQADSPEEIDPIEKLMKAYTQINRDKTADPKQSFSKENGTSTAKSSREEFLSIPSFLASVKSKQTSGSNTPSAPSSHTMTPQKEPSPALQGQNPNHSQGSQQTNGQQNVPPVVNPMTQPQDQSKATKNQLAPEKIVEVENRKPLVARRDAIVNKDSNENAPPLTRKHDLDDPYVVRMPILPDMPLSREGILKNRGGRTTKQLKTDNGFKLGDIVLMMICAVICNAANAHDMFTYLTAREKFFTTWLGLKNGLPSYRLLAILLVRFNPRRFKELIDYAVGKSSSEVLVRLKGVGVWESDRGIVLAELKEDASSATSALLEEVCGLFDISESILTVDFDKLDRHLSRHIIQANGNYLILLKGKHGIDYERAVEYFSVDLMERKESLSHATHRDVDSSPGMSALKEITVVEDVSWFSEESVWRGLKTIVQMLSEAVSENRTLTDKRFYLSSLGKDAVAISSTLRAHNTLEARVAWFLDIDFTSSKVDHTLPNFDQLRAFSWNLLNFDNSNHASADAKRRKAATDNTYLRVLLGLKAA